MPITSRAQQGYLFANKPRVARQMAHRMRGKKINGRRISRKHPLKGLPYRSRRARRR